MCIRDRLNTLVTETDAGGMSPDIAVSLLPDMLSRLKQLQSALVEMQNQVHQDIQTVDCLINGNC